jgi:3-deoxy-7-phosphoheptulonate synthase
VSINNKRVFGPTPKYPKVLAYPKGSDELITLAGPCSIESAEQVDKVIAELKKCPPTYMRGGVFRAGTYPSDNFGLKVDLLEMWSRKAKSAGLKIIVECLDVRQLATINLYADAIQIGARAMQNYALLIEVAKLDKPVFLKRHHGATIDEVLGACEYLCRGVCRPHIIERGSVSYLNHVRWELSVSMIAAIKRITNVPVLVDASHGTGRADLVQSLTLGGIAAGADGFLLEVHPDPVNSMSDSEQALPLEKYQEINIKATQIKEMLNDNR